MLNIEVGKVREMEFTLGKSKKVYKIPLAAHLPIDVIAEFRQFANADDLSDFDALTFEIKFLRRFMGDVVDTLTADTVAKIFEAWREECENDGQPVGE